jgi:Luciferase-like monooxygenase
MPAPLRLGFLSHLHGSAEPRQLYRDYVELFVAAEELGFDSGSVAQHHFDASAGRLPSPFPFLAAATDLIVQVQPGFTAPRRGDHRAGAAGHSGGAGARVEARGR